MMIEKKKKQKKVVWVNLELDKKVRHFRNYSNGQANALAEKLMSTNPCSQANEIQPDRGIQNQVEKARRKDMWPPRHGNDEAVRIADIKHKMNFRHGYRLRQNIFGRMAKKGFFFSFFQNIFMKYHLLPSLSMSYERQDIFYAFSHLQTSRSVYQSDL